MARRSAIDAISPALEHTKRQLLPFRWSQWWRLALLGLATGELGSSGGCHGGGSFGDLARIGQHGKSQQFLSRFPLDGQNVAALALAIGIGLFLVCVLLLIFMYVNAVCRFILIETLVQRRCTGIRAGWRKWKSAGWRYFLWALVYQLALGMFFAVVIGIPLGIAVLAGWWRNPEAHLVPLILGGVLLFFLIVAALVIAALTWVFGKDFMAPIMALEGLDFADAWSRLLEFMKEDVGGFAGYAGMKIVMTLAAAVLYTIVFLMLFLPLVLFIVFAIIGLKTAGVAWNVATVTLAVVAGILLLGLLMALVSLLSVPVAVFFPAYALYFFGSRYPKLDGWMFPLPPPQPPPAAPPEPVIPSPLPPINPEPIG